LTGQTRLAREKRPGSRDSREVARKLLHIAASVAATAIAWGLPAWSARVICVAAAVVAYIVEFVRLRSPAAGRKFLETFGPLLRARETRDITGATTLATGFAITIVLFPPPIAAVGFV
jgi:dolichol kinase